MPVVLHFQKRIHFALVTVVKKILPKGILPPHLVVRAGKMASLQGTGSAMYFWQFSSGSYMIADDLVRGRKNYNIKGKK